MLLATPPFLTFLLPPFIVPSFTVCLDLQIPVRVSEGFLSAIRKKMDHPLVLLIQEEKYNK